jgi:hypothetical protein
MASDDRPRIKPVDEVRLLRSAAFDHRLSRGDIGVFAVILSHCDAERRSFPGPALISKVAKLAVSNVKISLRALEVLRYIEVERPGLRKKNRYRVLDSPRVLPRVVYETSRRLGSSVGRRPSGKNLAKPFGAKSGDAGMQPTGLVDVQQLGMHAGHEVASKALLKSQEKMVIERFDDGLDFDEEAA